MNATRLFYGNLIRFTVYPNSWIWIQHDLQLSSMIKGYQNWKWQITTILKALHNFVHEHFLRSLLLYWCFQPAAHSFCQVQTSPDKKWLCAASIRCCTLFLVSFARWEYDSPRTNRQADHVVLFQWQHLHPIIKYCSFKICSTISALSSSQNPPTQLCFYWAHNYSAVWVM